jgi:signal transduction histidine kinase
VGRQNGRTGTTTLNLVTSGDTTGVLDDARLHQVFCNLLINAAHYGAKEHPISISATGDADMLVVQVMNRGPVIPAESLQSIFSPLIQLSKEVPQDARPATSLGLGLYIAREISEAHGGTIEVESSEANGTTFTVRLPKRTSTSENQYK